MSCAVFKSFYDIPTWAPIQKVIHKEIKSLEKYYIIGLANEPLIGRISNKITGINKKNKMCLNPFVLRFHIYSLVYTQVEKNTKSFMWECNGKICNYVYIKGENIEKRLGMSIYRLKYGTNHVKISMAEKIRFITN